MGDHDPTSDSGTDDTSMLLKQVTHKIDETEARLRGQLALYPHLRRAMTKAPEVGTLESLHARRLIADRRRRDVTLGGHLFGEPAWDMLLDMFVAHDEQRKLTVSSVCLAAAVPPTTALRHLSLLVAEGMILRTPDPHDGRKVLLELAAETVARMRHLLRSGAESELV